MSAPERLCNEAWLRSEIVRTWGPAGAHVDLFDTIMRRAERAPQDVAGLVAACQPFVAAMEDMERRWLARQHADEHGPLPHELELMPHPSLKLTVAHARALRLALASQGRSVEGWVVYLPAHDDGRPAGATTYTSPALAEAFGENPAKLRRYLLMPVHEPRAEEGGGEDV